MLQVILFKHCFVRVLNADYMETVFFNGGICPALFVRDDAACRLAKELGYGENVDHMHYEHDLVHTFLAEEADGLRYSPVLARVAGLIDVPDEQRLHEEGRAVRFQRYLNTGEREELLTMPNLEPLSERFKEVFRCPFSWLPDTSPSASSGLSPS